MILNLFFSKKRTSAFLLMIGCLAFSTEKVFAQSQDFERKTVEIAGTDYDFFFLEAESNSKNYLVVFPDFYGVSTEFCDGIVTLLNERTDVHIIVADYYNGLNADNPDDAAKLYSKIADETHYNLTQAILGFIGKNKNVAILGYHFGGLAAYSAVFRMPEKAKKSLVLIGYLPETKSPAIENLSMMFVNSNSDQVNSSEKIDTLYQSLSKNTDLPQKVLFDGRIEAIMPGCRSFKNDVFISLIPEFDLFFDGVFGKK
ncbi:MAG: hypothetical protein KKA07_14600 [Bacteroidetes bacterium]|nr:hypothetical protein [Bacteroidota bacterium]MBU1720290.1 hypothetical protein [Bacteroidota bacterium]